MVLCQALSIALLKCVIRTNLPSLWFCVLKMTKRLHTYTSTYHSFSFFQLWLKGYFLSTKEGLCVNCMWHNEESVTSIWHPSLKPNAGMDIKAILPFLPTGDTKLKSCVNSDSRTSDVWPRSARTQTQRDGLHCCTWGRGPTASCSSALSLCSWSRRSWMSEAGVSRIWTHNSTAHSNFKNTLEKWHHISRSHDGSACLSVRLRLIVKPIYTFLCMSWWRLIILVL